MPLLLLTPCVGVHLEAAVEPGEQEGAFGRTHPWAGVDEASGQWARIAPTASPRPALTSG
jgi:hypothetical protein